MFDENKLEVIRKYLSAEFNTSEIADEEDFDREAQTFEFYESGRIYLVTVAREFIDDNDAESIIHILEKYPLKRFFDNPSVKSIVFNGPGQEIISE